MLKRELTEAINIVNVMIDALLKSVPSRQGRQGADLRRQCGDVLANVEEMLQDKTIFAELLLCFQLAHDSAATYPTMNRVRSKLQEQAPTMLAGIAVKEAGIRFALVQMSVMLAETQFKSRNDVDAALKSVSIAFDAAVIEAADDLASGVYQALINLYSATVIDLVDRGRPLPRIVHYNFNTRFPALWLAQRIHWSGTRYLELIDENKPVHPLFMQLRIRALSA